MQHRNIDGRAIAGKILDEVRAETARLTQRRQVPKLVSIKVGENPAVDRYIRNQKRHAEKVGIDFVEQHFPSTTTAAQVIEAIDQMNEDPSVTGIILQRPIPEPIPIKILQESILPMNLKTEMDECTAATRF